MSSCTIQVPRTFCPHLYLNYRPLSLCLILFRLVISKQIFMFPIIRLLQGGMRSDTAITNTYHDMIILLWDSHQNLGFYPTVQQDEAQITTNFTSPHVMLGRRVSKSCLSLLINLDLDAFGVPGIPSQKEILRMTYRERFPPIVT